MDPQSGTIKERVRSLDAPQFADEINGIWQAVEQVKDTVVEQVQSGRIMPADGLEILGCVASKVFGHDSLPTTDFLTSLAPTAGARR